MRAVLLATVIVFVNASLAPAQLVKYSVFRNGTQVIVDIEPVPPFPIFGGALPQPAFQPPMPAKLIDKKEPVPAPLPAKEKKADKSASIGTPANPSVLVAKDWRDGQAFADDQGRQWKLVSGLRFATPPAQLNGWRLVTADGKHNFFTLDGRLFARD